MTRIMGIVNLTPDSFSGDGMLQNEQQALSRVDTMIADGASVIDIGAESTRPNATPLTPEEEWQRLAPVLEVLGSRRDNVTFSIDTRHAEVAKKAVAHGISWINDVSGGSDTALIDAALESGATYVPMHSLGIPVDPKRTLPETCNPMDEVLTWAEQLLTQLDKRGMNRAQIILDPGIGFGKTPLQSLALIKDISRLMALGLPVLVGHSRKSFLSLFTAKPSEQRDPETLVFSRYLVDQKVDYLRVHDVKSHSAMLRIAGAL